MNSKIFSVVLAALLVGQPAFAQTFSRQPGGEQNMPLPDISLPPIDYISPAKTVLTPKEKNALKLTRAFHDRNIPPVLAENGRVTYAFGLTMPSVVCAPFMVSDIELQPGEFVNDVVLGDTVRWKVSLARSGSPETSHLIVKPMDAGLETTVVIATDRRIYHIILKSQKKGHMSYVGFVYPEDASAILEQEIAAQRKRETWETGELPVVGAIDLAKLAFDYEVRGDAAWKPVQVFNDGRQTYVRLPKSVSQSEMPVLLVRRNDGDVLVNYRVREDTLVVDDIFAEAVLLAGVGSDQKRVVIRRLN